MRALVLFILFGITLLVAPRVHAQGTISDSTYLRIADRTKAMEAIRFDLGAYNDTLRVYRDAVDAATSRVDASTTEGEARKSRLGMLRKDVNGLDKEMAKMRKRMKRSAPPFEESAHNCSALLQRVRALRLRLLAEGARPDR